MCASMCDKKINFHFLLGLKKRLSLGVYVANPLPPTRLSPQPLPHSLSDPW